MTPVLLPDKEQSTAPDAPLQERRAGIKHRLIECVVAVCTVIFILECLFAAAGVGEQEYLRVDKTLGFVPMENKHVTWRKEGYGSIQFNSQGRNDIERPFTKPANTYRIAIVGDSFVESLQVDRSQNFCTLLERTLNARYGARHHIEVLNFGCSANSLGQFYKKIDTQVLRYQPDVVMIGVSVDATKLLAPLQGGFAFANARPTFMLDKKGNLVEDWQIFHWWNSSPEGKRFARTEFLRQYSHIWGAIGTMMGSYSSWLEDFKAGKVWGWGQVAQQPAHFVIPPKVQPKAGSYSAINSSCGGSTGSGNLSSTDQTKAAASTIALPQAQGDVEAATKQYWPIADKLIRAMANDCRAHNCRFAVAHLPARPEIGYDNPVETKNLETLTSALSVPYIDLTPAFLSAPKETSLIYSVHMTPAGHKLAYSEFLKLLESNKLSDN